MHDIASFRRNVGIVVFNKNAKIWLGKRVDTNNINAWQMPQGGIIKGELPIEAAIRELYEETGIKSIKHIALIDNWLKYKLPINIAKSKWNGKYVGQMQQWFLFYFFGKDAEVNINLCKDAEFSDWQWQDTEYILENIPEFRRKVYENVFKNFRGKIKPIID